LDGDEIARLIDELETRVERLRALYDQYFVGIERLEPLVLRKDVDRRLWVLRREQIRNTALRFKLETTIQRYNTYQQYWQRIVREIENGTYQRDLGRALSRFGDAATAFGRRRQKMVEKGLARRAEREGRRARSSAPAPVGSEPPDRLARAASSAPAAPSEAPAPPGGRAPDASFDGWDVPVDLELELQSSRPPPPIAPPVAPVPPPVPAPVLAHVATETSLGARPSAARPAGSVNSKSLDKKEPPREGESTLSAARMRQIYGEYVEAKRRANESTAALTFEKMAANLRQTAQTLRAKHAGAHVDFEVVLKDGKPAIKPLVKR
jgi:hypothetical protein